MGVTRAETPSPISNAALNRATLARQMLLAREKTTVPKAVARLVALQAQLPRPPFIGLWTRVAGFRREDLTNALADRTVVRGTSLRGTLHLMTAADYVAFRGAIQPSLEAGLSVVRGRVNLTDLDAALALGREHFKKGPTPFEPLRDAIRKRFPKADERAMAYAVRLYVPLLQVPGEAVWGFEPSCDFTMAELWLKKPVSIEHARAHDLVKRYLAAYGPAAPADAQTFLGLKGLREVFEELRPKLVTFQDEKKRELFDLPDAPRPSASTPAPVRLLPEFDSLVLGHADRERIVAREHASKITTKNLQVAAIFLVDGMAAGTWKVEGTKKSPKMTITPWGKLSKSARKDVDDEAGRLLEWIKEQDQDQKPSTT